MMSAKTRLAEAIAAFPDSLTIEEAVDRLYRAFKLKQEAERAAAPEENGWPPGWFEATTGTIDDPTFVRGPQETYEVREGLG